MEKLLLPKISIFLLSCIVVAFAASAGGYGGAVYRAPLSAAALGRGGAALANPELGLAIWNPALASKLKGFRLSFGGAVLPLGRGDGFLAGEGRIGRSRLGLSGVFLYRGVHDLGKQIASDGSEIPEGESYTTFTAKAGLSFSISKRFSLGLSMGWLYSSFPVDFTDNTISYGKSSTLGGITIIGAWQLPNGLALAAGVNDLFTSSKWDRESDATGYSATLTDTSLAPIVAGASYKWDIFGQSLRIDSDLKIYLFNSYFSGLEHPYSYWDNGVSLGINNLIEFRIGVGDFLLTSSMFNDKELYQLESVPKLSGGVGVILDERIDLAGLKVNYAVSGTGIGAGLNHVFDFLFEF